MSRFLLILTCALLINHVDSERNSKNITVETTTVDYSNWTENFTNFEKEIEENKKVKQELVEATLRGMPVPSDRDGEFSALPVLFRIAGVLIAFGFVGAVVFICLRCLSQEPNPRVQPPAGNQARARNRRAHGNNNREEGGQEMQPMIDPNFLAPPVVSGRRRPRSSSPVNSGLAAAPEVAPPSSVSVADPGTTVPRVPQLSSDPESSPFLQKESASEPPLSPPATVSGANSELPTVSQDHSTTVPAPNSAETTVHQSTSTAELPTDTESPTVSQNEPTTDATVSETTALFHVEDETSV